MLPNMKITKVDFVCVEERKKGHISIDSNESSGQATIPRQRSTFILFQFGTVLIFWWQKSFTS